MKCLFCAKAKENRVEKACTENTKLNELFQSLSSLQEASESCNGVTTASGKYQGAETDVQSQRGVRFSSDEGNC